MLRILTLVEDKLYRDPLNDFHVIAGGILRRQQTELRAGSRSDAVDMRIENPASESIDGDCCALSRTHFGKLCLFEIRSNPDIFHRHDGHQRLARLNNLARLDGFLADVACDWRLHTRVFQIQERLIECCIREPRARFSGLRLSLGDDDLLWRRLRSFSLSQRLLQFGLLLRSFRFSDFDFMLYLYDAGLSRVDGGARSFGGTHSGIVLLL